MNNSTTWALVTGASAGLGVEFARQLAKKGHSLILVARRGDRLEQLSIELKKQYAIDSVILVEDLSSAGAASRIVSALARDAIVPDVLVNNAGFGLQGDAIDLSIERQAEMIRLNIGALTELALAIGKQMAVAKRGAILNVASTAGFQPVPGMAVYGATKSYVIYFSMALSNELSKHGVHVVALCPGITKTDFFQANGVSFRAPDFLSMTAEKCVALGIRAIEKKRPLAITGWINKVVAFLARMTPLRILTVVSGKVARSR